jgi:guanyl-specific ribonuclease Sa
MIAAEICAIFFIKRDPDGFEFGNDSNRIPELENDLYEKYRFRTSAVTKEKRPTSL